MSVRIFLIAAFVAMTATVALAADTNSVAGVWLTEERDAKIEIAVDGSGIASGRIIAVAPDDADDLDDHNPDAGLRARPVLGLTILQGFRQGTDGKWSGGTIYDPDSGTTYSGTLSMDGNGRLLMRGSVLFGLFGRTETLTRVIGPAPATHQPGEPDLVPLAPPAAATTR